MRQKEKRKATLKAELLRRYKHFDEGLISKEVYLMYKAQIESQINIIDKELEQWDAHSNERRETINGLLTYIRIWLRKECLPRRLRKDW